MIVVEYSTDEYGKVMKHLACIKEKAEELESILQDSTFNQRKPRHHWSEEEDEYEPKKRSRYDSSRYV